MFNSIMTSRTIKPSSVEGSVKIPASKSQTIRALLIASMAEGESRIRNPLISGDTQSCLEMCRSFGAEVTSREGEILIRGIGGMRKEPDEKPVRIDVGNSGTTLYLGIGLAAFLGKPAVFTGDGQIRKRPLGELASSLRDLGADCRLPAPKELRDALKTGEPMGDNAPPCYISGPLTGGRTAISCPTSQYLSSLLLCCPLSEDTSIIEVPLLYEQPYVELTLEWLKEQGISFRQQGYSLFSIPGKQKYRPFDKAIAGDYSSASFFFCAAAVTGSTLTVQGIHRYDPQGDREILHCLEKMGCSVSWNHDTEVTVTGPPKGGLKCADLDLNHIPDTLPVLAVTACFASGTSSLYNVPQARIKETDRIEVMRKELTKLGCSVEEVEDGLVITGSRVAGGSVEGHKDHRVIMALAVAALAAEEAVTIDDVTAVEITFPDFFSLLEAVSKNRRNNHD